MGYFAFVENHLRAQLPSGGSIAAGQAAIASSSNSMHIATQSDRTVIDWQSFSIGPGSSVQFQQPSASSAVLNRVIGPGLPSDLSGALTSNGQVFLSNPHGIVVGPSGVIQTNGFTATTLDISKQEFLRGGTLSITGDSRNAIINQGNIQTGQGGTNLIAAQVINQGQIRSQGTINLATGGSIALMNGAVYSQADIKTIASGISGTANLIKNSGELRATGALTVGGNVYLVNPGGSLINSGTMKAERVAASSTGSTGVNTTGGNIGLQAKHIHIQSPSSMEASGTHGGGQVLIGNPIGAANQSIEARSIQVDRGATIDASALHTGNGGNVVISSHVQDGTSKTEVHGHIFAKGGVYGGDGGHIETSGDQINVAGMVANASAIRGKAGTWLIDPTNLFITTSPTTGNSNVQNSDIENSLNSGTNVTLQTASAGSDEGNIFVDAPIHKSSGTDATLTLKAHGSIFVNREILSTSHKLHLIFNSNAAAMGAGAIIIASDLQTLGGNIAMGGGSDPLLLPAIGTSSDGIGIQITGAQIDAGGGDIVMRGVGDRTVPNRVGAYGVSILGSSLATSGNGRISIFGDAGGIAASSNSPFNIGIAIGGQSSISSERGDIKLFGAGGGLGTPGLGLNHGIYFTDPWNSITSIDGNVRLEGNGGSGAYSVGVLAISDNILRTTGNGNLTLIGNGGPDYGSAGVFLESSLSTARGNIHIDGVGASAGGMTSDGVYLGYMIGLESQGGSISIAGAGGTGPDSHGILIDGQIRTYGDGTQISLTTDNLQIDSDTLSTPSLASISAGTRNGSVTIQNLTPNAQIHAGGSDSAGILGITSSELSRIQSTELTIGSGASGNLIVSEGLSLNASLFTVRSGNDLRIESPIHLAGTSGAGGFRAQAAGHLALGALGQISTDNGDIELIANRFTNAAITPALLPSGTGKHWRIWSTNTNPYGSAAPDLIGNLDYDFKQYRAQFGVSSPQGTGNGLLYALAPTATATFVGPVTKYYDGTTTAILSDANFVVNGLVGGDVLVIPTGTYDTPKTIDHKTVSIPMLTDIANHGKPVFGYALHTANQFLTDASITWSPAYLRDFNARIAELNSRGFLDRTIPYDPMVAGVILSIEALRGTENGGLLEANRSQGAD